MLFVSPNYLIFIEIFHKSLLLGPDSKNLCCLIIRQYCLGSTSAGLSLSKIKVLLVHSNVYLIFE